MNRILILLFGAAACGLCGCTTVAPFRGLSLDERTIYVSGVPPVRQDARHACGAASVAAVAAHWGVPLDKLKSDDRLLADNTTGRDLQILAERVGLQAFVFKGSMADLQDNLAKGRPLIVMLPKPVVPSGGLIMVPLMHAWNEFGSRPSHWLVVVGFIKDRELIVYDPDSGPLRLAWHKFEKWWAERDNLCVLIAAPAEA